MEVGGVFAVKYEGNRRSEFGCQSFEAGGACEKKVLDPSGTLKYQTRKKNKANWPLE